MANKSKQGQSPKEYVTNQLDSVFFVPELTHEQREDALCLRLMNKIISFYAEEATEELPRLHIDGEDVSDTAPYSEAIAVLEELDALTVFRKAQIWANVHKTQYVFIGLKVVNVDVMKEVYAQPVETLDSDNELVLLNFRKVEKVEKVKTESGEMFYRIAVNSSRAKDLIVHPSRILEFTDPTYGERSLLEQIYKAVAKLEEVYDHLNELIETFSTLKVGADNLTPSLLMNNQGGGQKKVTSRLARLRMGLSNFNALIFDRRTEDVTFLERKVTGVKEVYYPAYTRVLALSNIPEMMLFMVQRQGSLSEGNGIRERMTVEKFTKRLQAHMKPNWQRVYRLALSTETMPRLVFSSSLELNPLEQAQVDETNARTRKLNAESDQLENTTEE